MYQEQWAYIEAQLFPWLSHLYKRLSEIIGDVNSHFASASWFDLVRDVSFLYVVCRILAIIEYFILDVGIITLWKDFTRKIFGILVNLPVVRRSVDKQVDKALIGIENQVIERPPQLDVFSSLPKVGMSPKEIQLTVRKLESLKRSSWEKGRLSGAVYHGGAQLLKLQTDMYGLYTVANQLHPDCFPAIRRMEAEVVSMVLKLYNAPEEACGTSTSGGTESLLLACLSAREKARVEKGITQPEIIAPVTIHAGFNKAAHYFGMKLRHAPIDPQTAQVDLRAVESMIRPNTVLLAGSAPNFPHGAIDNIEGLGELAEKYGLPLHVDACLGSFYVPFLSKLGHDVPTFDFRVPGVTSISCDTHKYGFAPKGSSIIMYRNTALRHYQYFVCTDWTGGLYASPTLAGSRPGALMAGCWATLLYMGYDGYLKSAKTIRTAVDTLKAELTSSSILSENLSLIGDPQGPVVAFSSNVLNIYDLSDILSEQGWHLSALQNPPAIHIAVTRLTLPVVDELISALKIAVTKLIKEGSSKASDDTKALYGIAGSVKTAGIAERLALGFVDSLYKI